MRLGLALQLGDDLGGERVGRQRAGAVAGVDAGLLDVLHDAGDEDVACRRRGRRRRPRWRRRGSWSIRTGLSPETCTASRDVAVELRVVADDLHGAAAEHVGRADDERVAELARRRRAPRSAERAMPLRGWLEVELVRAAAGSARGPRPGRWRRAVVPRIGMPASCSACGELQRGLAAELDDDADAASPFALLDVGDLEHVLGGQRLEVEPVGGVVVGRDGLGVAVDHDRLDSRPRSARSRRGSSSSRTRCPGRCGWGRRRG